MTDTALLEQQIEGLKAKLSDLRQKERAFTKMQGIEEEAEKLKTEIITTETSIHVAKEEIAELKGQKAEAVKETAQALAERMAKILPNGKALFGLDNGKVFLGLKRDNGRITPYDGLSGSEKVTFDSALAFALLGDSTSKVFVIEAAETDNANLKALMDLLKKQHSGPEHPGTQFIINTCHAPKQVPEGWNITVLKE